MKTLTFNIKPLTLKVYPDDVLREKAEAICHFDTTQIEQLVDNMLHTMTINHGIGLAAPQVGIGKRIIVFKKIGEEHEENTYIINPEIIHGKGHVSVEEGCLSIPSVTSHVDRHATVIIRGFDKYGKPLEWTTDKFWSIIVQHEIDHLNGTLFIDRLSLIKRKMLLSKYKKRIQS